MEAAAEPMTIAVRQHTYELIRNDFVLSELGEIEIKGFGTQHVWSLDRETTGR